MCIRAKRFRYCHIQQQTAETMSERVPFSVLLVTGGCGFISSNFINYTLEHLPGESKVINYDCLSSASNKTNVDSSGVSPGQYVLICGDLCNGTLLQRVLHRFSVDAVVHFAAQTHVYDSYVPRSLGVCTD